MSENVWRELEAEAVRVENECEVCGRPSSGVWCRSCSEEERRIEERGGWGGSAA